LKQTTTQASSTNANHRPESWSHRSCSRRQQLSHDSNRSSRQRWRPSLAEDSTPRRATLQRLPKDAELLAFEAGCEDYCEREIDEVE
jgi:hypothetical protein